MALENSLFHAEIMHYRHAPTGNGFVYHLDYLYVNIDNLPAFCKGISLPLEKYGVPEYPCKRTWLEHIYRDGGGQEHIEQIMLMTLPTLWGYAFNPVSFYMCYDAQEKIRMIVAEVHNTFGERHFYVCHHASDTEITGEQVMIADKMFHVSPFFPREGEYHFRFDLHPQKFTIHIDYYLQAQKMLSTSMRGHLTTITPACFKKIRWQSPFLLFKVMILIHWQALKLWLKKNRYFYKPEALRNNKTNTKNK